MATPVGFGRQPWRATPGPTSTQIRDCVHSWFQTSFWSCWVFGSVVGWLDIGSVCSGSSSSSSAYVIRWGKWVIADSLQAVNIASTFAISFKATPRTSSSCRMRVSLRAVAAGSMLASTSSLRSPASLSVAAPAMSA